MESVKVLDCQTAGIKRLPIDENKPQMDQNNNQKETMQESILSNNGQQRCLGKLYFKLKYSYEKRALCLVIIRCTDLPLKESNGVLDPYVKMQLLPEKQHKVSG